MHKDPRLQSNSADLVFSRLVPCGMTDWAGYVREAFGLLKPGGWCEMGDYVEDMFYADPAKMLAPPREKWEWLKAIRDGGKRRGLDLDAGLTVKGYMEAAGFVGVRRWEYRIPFWMGALEQQPEARLMTEHVIEYKRGLYWHMLPNFLQGSGYGEKDLERFRGDMRRDTAEEEGKHQLFCVTIGRKPDA